MGLFKKCNQTPEPEPVAEPSPKPGGKGHPTPRCRDQQAKNLHPVVSRDRAATKRETRAARDAAWKRRNEAVITGEGGYFPPREKGPIKHYIRDFVDAYFNLGEYFIPSIFAPLIISFGFSSLLPHCPLVSFYTVLAMNGYLFLAIADAVWCWARLRRRLIAKSGQEKVKDEGTILFCIMSHCFMLRRRRRPATLVSRGQYPSRSVPDSCGAASTAETQAATRATEPVTRARLMRPGQTGPL